MQDEELTWADVLMEKVRQKRREEAYRAGLLEGKRHALLLQLAAKFGPLPESITKHIEGIDSNKVLNGYLDRVLLIDSLTDMELDA